MNRTQVILGDRIHLVSATPSPTRPRTLCGLLINLPRECRHPVVLAPCANCTKRAAAVDRRRAEKGLA